MATKRILIATQQLRGGVTKAKGGEVERHVAEKGTHLTSAVLKKLGLNAEAVEGLKAKGVIVEQDAMQADADDASDLDLLSGAELESVLLLRKVAIEPGTDKDGLIALIKSSKAG